MAVSLPDKMNKALESLSLPDSAKQKNDQLARIQRLQIAHHLECRDERPAFVQDVWWSQLPGFASFPRGSVSLVYSLFVAVQFFVRCVYMGGRARHRYDPTTITEARAFGTRFDLAVAKHVFDFFLAESTLRWREHVAENGTPMNLEHETQFLYGLWKDVVPKEDSHGHAPIALLMNRLTSEAARRFDCPKAPFPHDAVKLSQRSAFAHEAGHASQATLKPTTPTVLRGGAA